MRNILTATLLFLTLSCTSALSGDDEVSAQIESMHGNLQSFNEAFEKLTQAMANNDAEAIAQLSDYPLLVHANGETYDVQSGADVIDNFDTLVSQETRSIVANQAYGQLFVNGDGVMFGDGALWMHNACEDDGCNQSHWAITSINQ
jgi:hypothetical protein